MSDNVTQILVAVFTFLGLALPAYFVFKSQLEKSKAETRKAKAETEKAIKEKNDIIKKHLSSSFEIDFKNLNSIKGVVDEVLRSSHIDRFLMLSSVNGKDPVNFVSALFEQHKLTDTCKLSFGATSKYVDISTDEQYKNMIRTIELVTPKVYDVKEMSNGILKDIYEDEGVKHSYVIFTNRFSIDGDNDRLIFCSWSTHENKTIDGVLKIKVDSANNKIKQILDT